MNTSCSLYATPGCDNGAAACTSDNTYFYARSATLNVIKQHYKPPYSEVLYSDTYMGRINSISVNTEWGNPEKLVVTTYDEGYVTFYDFNFNPWTIKGSHDKHKVHCRSQLIDAIFFGSDTVVSFDESGFIILWDIRTNEKTESQLQVSDNVTRVSACPHRQGIVALGCKTGAIDIFDLNTMWVVHRLIRHTSAIMDLAWCPTEFNVFDAAIQLSFSREYLLASSALEDSTIVIWRTNPNHDRNRGIIQIELQSEPTKTKISLSWIAPLTLLSSNNWELLEWNLSRKTCNGLYNPRLVHKEHDYNILSIKAPIQLFKSYSPSSYWYRKSPAAWTVSKDGRVVKSAISSSVNLCIYKTLTDELVRELSTSKIDVALLEIFTNQEALQLIELGNSKGVIADTFKVVTHIFIYTLFKRRQRLISAIAWHPKRKNLLSLGTRGGNIYDIFMYFNTFEHLQPGNIYKKYKIKKYYPPIVALDWGPVPFSNDASDFGLYAVAEGHLVMFNSTATSQLCSEQTDPKVLLDTGNVTQVKWKPDFKICAVGTKKGEILFYNKNFGYSTKVDTKFSCLPINSLAWHPHATGKDLEVSPCNNWIAACTIFEIYVYEVEDFNLENTCTKQPHVVATLSCNLLEWRNIKNIDWNPHKSANLVAVTDDAFIAVWNVANDEVVALIQGPPLSKFYCVFWSPIDEDLVISVGSLNMAQWKISAHVLSQRKRFLIRELQKISHYDQRDMFGVALRIRGKEPEYYLNEKMRILDDHTKALASLLGKKETVIKIQTGEEMEEESNATRENGTKNGNEEEFDSHHKDEKKLEKVEREIKIIEDVKVEESKIQMGKEVEEESNAQEEGETKVVNKEEFYSQQEDEVKAVIIVEIEKVEKEIKKIEDVKVEETKIQMGKEVEEESNAQEESETKLGNKEKFYSQQEDEVKAVIIVEIEKVEKEIKKIEDVKVEETKIQMGKEVEEESNAQEEGETKLGNKEEFYSQQEDEVKAVIIVEMEKVEREIKKIEDVKVEETNIQMGKEVEEESNAQEEGETKVVNKEEFYSQQEDEVKAVIIVEIEKVEREIKIIEDVKVEETKIQMGKEVEEESNAQEEGETKVVNKEEFYSHQEDEVKAVIVERVIEKVKENSNAQGEAGTKILNKREFDCNHKDEIKAVVVERVIEKVEDESKDETKIQVGEEVEENSNAQVEVGVRIENKEEFDSHQVDEIKAVIVERVIEEVEDENEDERKIQAGKKVDDESNAQGGAGTNVGNKEKFDSRQKDEIRVVIVERVIENLEEESEDEKQIQTGEKIEEESNVGRVAVTKLENKVDCYQEDETKLAIIESEMKRIKDEKEDESKFPTGEKVQVESNSQGEAGTKVGNKEKFDSHQEDEVKPVLVVESVFEDVDDKKEDATKIQTGEEVEEEFNAQGKAGIKIRHKEVFNCHHKDDIKAVIVEKVIEEVENENEEKTKIQTGEEMGEECKSQGEAGIRIGNQEEFDSRQEDEVKTVVVEKVIEEVENKHEEETKTQTREEVGEECKTQGEAGMRIGNQEESDSHQEDEVKTVVVEKIIEEVENENRVETKIQRVEEVGEECKGQGEAGIRIANKEEFDTHQEDEVKTVVIVKVIEEVENENEEETKIQTVEEVGEECKAQGEAGIRIANQEEFVSHQEDEVKTIVIEKVIEEVENEIEEETKIQTGEEVEEESKAQGEDGRRIGNQEELDSHQEDEVKTVVVQNVIDEVENENEEETKIQTGEEVGEECKSQGEAGIRIGNQEEFVSHQEDEVKTVVVAKVIEEVENENEEKTKIQTGEEMGEECKSQGEAGIRIGNQKEFDSHQEDEVKTVVVENVIEKVENEDEEETKIQTGVAVGEECKSQGEAGIRIGNQEEFVSHQEDEVKTVVVAKVIEEVENENEEKTKIQTGEEMGEECKSQGEAGIRIGNQKEFDSHQEDEVKTVVVENVIEKVENEDEEETKIQTGVAVGEECKSQGEAGIRIGNQEEFVSHQEDEVKTVVVAKVIEEVENENEEKTKIQTGEEMGEECKSQGEAGIRIGNQKEFDSHQEDEVKTVVVENVIEKVENEDEEETKIQTGEEMGEECKSQGEAGIRIGNQEEFDSRQEDEVKTVVVEKVIEEVENKHEEETKTQTREEVGEECKTQGEAGMRIGNQEESDSHQEDEVKTVVVEKIIEEVENENRVETKIQRVEEVGEECKDQGEAGIRIANKEEFDTHQEDEVKTVVIVKVIEEVENENEEETKIQTVEEVGEECKAQGEAGIRIANQEEFVSHQEDEVKTIVIEKVIEEVENEIEEETKIQTGEEVEEESKAQGEDGRRIGNQEELDSHQEDEVKTVVVQNVIDEVENENEEETKIQTGEEVGEECKSQGEAGIRIGNQEEFVSHQEDEVKTVVVAKVIEEVENENEEKTKIQTGEEMGEECKSQGEAGIRIGNQKEFDSHQEDEVKTVVVENVIEKVENEDEEETKIQTGVAVGEECKAQGEAGIRIGNQEEFDSHQEDEVKTVVVENVIADVENENEDETKIQTGEEVGEECKAQGEAGIRIGNQEVIDSHQEDEVKTLVVENIIAEVENENEEETKIQTGQEVGVECKAHGEAGIRIGNQEEFDSHQEDEVKTVVIENVIAEVENENEDETKIQTGEEVGDECKAQRETGIRIGNQEEFVSHHEDEVKTVVVEEKVIEEVENENEEETKIQTGEEVGDECKAQGETGIRIGNQEEFDSHQEDEVKTAVVEKVIEEVENENEEETKIQTGEEVGDECKAQGEDGIRIGNQEEFDSHQEDEVRTVVVEKVIEEVENENEEETKIPTGEEVEEECKAQGETGIRIGNQEEFDSHHEDEVKTVVVENVIAGVENENEEETKIQTGQEVGVECKAHGEAGIRIGNQEEFDSHQEDEVKTVVVENVIAEVENEKEDETKIQSGEEVEEECKAQGEVGIRIGNQEEFDSHQEDEVKPVLVEYVIEEVENENEEETKIQLGEEVGEECKAQGEAGIRIGNQEEFDSHQENEVKTVVVEKVIEEVENKSEEETNIQTGQEVGVEFKAHLEAGIRIWNQEEFDSHQVDEIIAEIVERVIEKVQDENEGETKIQTGKKVEEESNAQGGPGTKILNKEVFVQEGVLFKEVFDSHPKDEIKAVIEERIIEEVEVNIVDVAKIQTGEAVEEKSKVQGEAGTKIENQEEFNSHEEDEVKTVVVEKVIEDVEHENQDETKIQAGEEVEEECKAQGEAGTKIGNKEEFDSLHKDDIRTVILERVIEGVEAENVVETKIQTGKEVEEESNPDGVSGTNSGNKGEFDSHQVDDIIAEIVERVIKKVQDENECETSIQTGIKVEEESNAQGGPGTKIGNKEVFDSHPKDEIKAVIVERIIEEVEDNIVDVAKIQTGEAVEEKSKVQGEAGTKIGNQEEFDSHEEDEVKTVVVEKVIKKVEHENEDETKIQTGEKVEEESNAQGGAGTKIGNEEEFDSRRIGVIVERIIEEELDESEDEGKLQTCEKVEGESCSQKETWIKIGIETKIEELESETDVSSGDSYDIISEDEYADTENILETGTKIGNAEEFDSHLKDENKAVIVERVVEKVQGENESETKIQTGENVEEVCNAQGGPGTKNGNEEEFDSRRIGVIVERIIEEELDESEDEGKLQTGEKVEGESHSPKENWTKIGIETKIEELENETDVSSSDSYDKISEDECADAENILETGTKIGNAEEFDSHLKDEIKVQGENESETKIQTGENVEEESNAQGGPGTKIGNEEEFDSRRIEVIVEKITEEELDESEDEGKLQTGENVEGESYSQKEKWTKIGIETKIEELESETDVSSSDSYDKISEDECADAENILETGTKIGNAEEFVSRLKDEIKVHDENESETKIQTGENVEEESNDQGGPGTKIGNDEEFDSRRIEVIVEKITEEELDESEDEGKLQTGENVEGESYSQKEKWTKIGIDTKIEELESETDVSSGDSYDIISEDECANAENILETGTKIGNAEEFDSHLKDENKAVIVERVIEKVLDENESETKIQMGEKVEDESNAQGGSGKKIGNEEEFDSRRIGVIVERIIEEELNESEDEQKLQTGEKVERESYSEKEKWTKIGIETKIEELESETDVSSGDSYDVISEDECADAENILETDKVQI